MNPNLLKKLTTLSKRSQELEALLATPDVINDQNKFREYAKEYSSIKPVVSIFEQFNKTQTDIAAAQAMLQDKDIRELAQEELHISEQKSASLENEIKHLLLPKTRQDKRNIFLEIRAGTGGQEAALFTAVLLKMYSRYAELRGWQIETVNQMPSELNGYKEIIVLIIGHDAYSRLRFESGVHRVQRIPETESQGRIHTSACTVAVMPEVDKVDTIELNTSDLRIDTFRASGAGGQHVNKTDSAIRVMHIPTGTIVECQDERSQHKNKARALSLLKAKLTEVAHQEQVSEQAQNRKNMVGSGDRSERIRTYNFPQGRITDHRINLTLYKLEEFIEGNIDMVINPLISEHQAEELSSAIR